MMTAEQLKGSILQLAMQGKLVEQRPEEGTGEELYKKIQAEKNRLIKEGKIKRQKSLADISDEEAPFDIPETWKWTHLDSSISLLSGTDLTPDKYNSIEKGIVYITGASNIENGKVIINRWTEYPKTIAHKGDLLLTCKGTVGKTAILDLDEVHIARQIMVITPIICCVDFVNYFIQFIVTDLKKKAKSMIPGIERASVLNAPFPIPPLLEQKRIVSKIEELMPFVEQYAAASTNLNTLNTTFPDMMKKSILQEAVQGKLVPQDPNDEPASVLLKKIAEEKKRLIKEGLVKKEKAIEPPQSDDIPFDIPDSWEWIRFGAVNYNRASGVIDKVEKYLFDKPLLLIGEDGANLINRSTPIAFIAKGKYWVNNHAHVIDMSPLLDMSYIAYYINSISLAKYVTGTAQPKMNQAKMNSIWVPIPPLAEQRRIVAKIEELLPIVKELVC